MLSLISFILLCIGGLNWFSIGILQYDFVAGIFGSQSNVFSRLIYALVGIAMIIVAFNAIKNRGKVIELNKETEYESYKESERKDSLALNTESSKDIADKIHTKNNNSYNHRNNDK